MKNLPPPPPPMPSSYYTKDDLVDVHADIKFPIRPVTLNPPPPPSPPAPTTPQLPSTTSAPSSNLEDQEPQTHDQLLDTIIRTTLKPIHATDHKILQFIANYNLCRDVRQAAKESGLTATDGKNLIQRPDIYECVQRIAAAGARKFGYDAEEIVAKVKEVVEFDPIDLYNPKTGAYYESLDDVPPETRRVIKKLHVMNVYDKDPNGVVIGISAKIIKYEFWDKLKAAEMLGQEKEVFKKQLKVEHDVGANMKDTLLGRLNAVDERRALMAKDVSK